jgi:hypothetical protein
MYVYELLIDFDMTTQSSSDSYGLFKTKELAEERLKSLEIKVWQWSEIKKRKVCSWRDW